MLVSVLTLLCIIGGAAGATSALNLMQSRSKYDDYYNLRQDYADVVCSINQMQAESHYVDLRCQHKSSAPVILSTGEHVNSICLDCDEEFAPTGSLYV